MVYMQILVNTNKHLLFIKITICILVFIQMVGFSSNIFWLKLIPECKIKICKLHINQFPHNQLCKPLTFLEDLQEVNNILFFLNWDRSKKLKEKKKENSTNITFQWYGNIFYVAIKEKKILTHSQGNFLKYHMMIILLEISS